MSNEPQTVAIDRGEAGIVEVPVSEFIDAVKHGARPKLAKTQSTDATKLSATDYRAFRAAILRCSR